MDPAGEYYLTGDITLTDSYANGFTGTFNGNGHTVTTYVPMFADFGGTIKNLTVEGVVTGAAAVAATSTCAASGSTVVFENIVNNANITSDTYAGSLIGQFGKNKFDYGANLEVTNCVNNGNITAATEIGGFVAAAYFNGDANLKTDAGATFTGCTNNGAILSTGGYTGGLFGRPMYTKAGVKFVGCVNNGDVTGLKNTGGFVGHTTNSCFFASYCVNNGNIKSTDAGKGSDRYAGGIIAYAQGIKLEDYSASKGGVANRIEYCLNTGTITGRSNTAGIAAHTGASGTYGLSSVTYCVNIGNVVAEDVDNSQSGNCVAGILGHAYGTSSENQATEVKNCITTGNVTMTWDSKDNLAKPGIVSYFLGYCSSKYVTIENNVGSGTLTSSGDIYAFGWNNKFTFKSLAGNQLPEGCTYALTYENKVETKTEDAKDGYTWTVSDLTTLTSGEYVYNFNEGYKAAVKSDSDLLYMFIDGKSFEIETEVKVKSGITNIVAKDEGGKYYNVEAKDAKDLKLAVNSSDEFLNMEPGLNYYLTGDIVLEGTYSQGFTGTFDGCGHTVTISKPMFANFGGTIKNLTVKGNSYETTTFNIGEDELQANAAIAVTVNCETDKVVFENITTNVDISSLGFAGSLIGIYGYNKIDSGVSLEVINCTNHGNIDGNQATGGFVGCVYFNSNTDIKTDAYGKFVNCVNEGYIISYNSYCGGIIGRPMYTKSLELIGCINKNHISGGNNSGGIVGHTTDVSLKMNYCVNLGSVYASGNAGGMVGSAQGPGLEEFRGSLNGYANLIENCLNGGYIDGWQRVGGIVGNLGKDSSKYGISSIKNCVNLGDLMLSGGKTGSKASCCIGGIVGYAYGDNKNDIYVTLDGCIVKGTITSLIKNSISTYFIGYSNSTYLAIKNCVADGDFVANKSGSQVYAMVWVNKRTLNKNDDGYVSIDDSNSLPQDCAYAHTYENGADKTYTVSTADLSSFKDGKFKEAFNKGFKEAAGTTKNAFDHIESNWIIDKEATCTEPGSQHTECLICGKKMDESKIDPSHTLGNRIIDKEATCEAEGAWHRECTVCNQTVQTGTIEKLAHTESDWIVDKAATGTEDGSKHTECTVCGAKIQTEVIPATGAEHTHTPSDWITDKEATCGDAGHKYIECTECHAVLSEQVIAATGNHNSLWITHDTEATCTEGGTYHAVCETCNKTVYNGISNPLGHRDGEWVTDKEPTCTEKGSEHLTCRRCGETIDTRAIDMLEHRLGDWIVDKEATETEKGSKHKECLDCGQTIETEAIDMLGHVHVPSDWIIDKKPTCDEEGSQHKECTGCGETLEKEPIKATGHTESDWITDKEPTCTETGTKHTECTECKETINTGTIGMIAHTEGEWIIDKAAKCDEMGIKHSECTVCGVKLNTRYFVLNTPTIPDGTMIFYEDFNGFANTTDTDTVLELLRKSNGGVWKADSVLDPYYSNFAPYASDFKTQFAIIDGKLQVYGYKDAEGNVISGSTDNYLVIDDESRFWELNYNDYTIQYDVCYQGESTKNASKYICVLWNYLSQYYYSFHFRLYGRGNLQVHTNGWSTLDAIGSEFYAAGSDTESTGSSIINKLCGKTYVDTKTDLTSGIEFSIRIQVSAENGPTVWMKVLGGAAEPTDWIKVSQYDATTSGASDWDKHNTEFGNPGGLALKIASANGTIDNLMVYTGHGDVPEDKTVTYVAAPLGTTAAHIESDWIVDKAANCTEGGHRHTECTVCGKILKDEDVVATGHTSSDWIEDKKATCDDDGSKHKECTVCGKTLETEPIPATGHTKSDWIEDKKATCEDKGHKYIECTTCHKQLEEKDIDATGHTESDWIVDKEATCTESGHRHTECTVCGKKFKDEDIKATGHAPSDWIVDKEPTADAAGYRHTECTICGEKLKEEKLNPPEPVKVVEPPKEDKPYKFSFGTEEGGKQDWLGGDGKENKTDVNESPDVFLEEVKDDEGKGDGGYRMFYYTDDNKKLYVNITKDEKGDTKVSYSEIATGSIFTFDANSNSLNATLENGESISCGVYEMTSTTEAIEPTPATGDDTLLMTIAFALSCVFLAVLLPKKALFAKSKKTH